MFAARASAPRQPDRAGRRARRLGAVRPVHRCDLRLPGRRPRPARGRHRRAGAHRASAAPARPHACCSMRRSTSAWRARACATAPTVPIDSKPSASSSSSASGRATCSAPRSEPARFRVVDASGDVEHVERPIRAALQPLLATRRRRDEPGRGRRQSRQRGDDEFAPLPIDLLPWHAAACDRLSGGGRVRSACRTACCCRARRASARSASPRRWPRRCSARVAASASRPAANAPSAS